MAELPRPGTYDIDPAHTSVEFVARHLVFTKVRGRFGDFAGTVVVSEAPEQSSTEVTIQAASVSTNDAQRDRHLRSADFFDVEEHPTLSFRSTKVEPAGAGWRLHGDLEVRGKTNPVVLDTTYLGAVHDPWGGDRVAFEASTEVDREAWGLTWNAALETGGVVVAKRVRLELQVQAVRRA